MSARVRCACVDGGGGGGGAACLVATISKCKSLVACGVGGTVGAVPDLRQAGRDALAAPSGPQLSAPDGNALHARCSPSASQSHCHL